MKRELLSIPGVSSVGETQDDGQVVIVIGVEIPEVADDARIPEEVLGHPVRVEVVGRFEPTIGIMARQDRESRVRPVRAGVSTANLDMFGGTGTLSLVLTDGQQWYLASNNHVWADNGDGAVGDRIIQPGTADGGDDGDVIGTLAGWEPISDGTTVDLAWASFAPPPIVESHIFGAPTAPAGVRTARPGDEVEKYGQRTDVTRGTVQQVNATVTVHYWFGAITLVDQVITDMVSGPGDSGSPVVTRDTHEAVGVVFAGSEDVTICNDIREWERVSGMEVVLADDVVCQTDADCPDGFTCESGSCVATGGGGDGGGGVVPGLSDRQAAILAGTVALGLAGAVVVSDE